jgi:hypothetical protein
MKLHCIHKEDMFNELELKSKMKHICSDMYMLRQHFSALPKILTDDLKFTGSTEGVGRIKISIYSYPALSQVTLLRHDQNVLSSDRNYVSEGIVQTSFYGKDVSLNGSIFEFEKHDLKKKDFGNYTLNVQNSIGTTMAIVSLNAEGKF